MISIHYHEFIRSRLEAAFSPHGKAGYQTIYVSPDAPSEFQDATIQRLSVYRAQEGFSCGWKCFFTSDARIGLVRTVSVQTNLEMVDSAGRPDVCLAHGLLLDQASSKKIEFNPFALIDSFQFVSHPKEIVGPAKEKRSTTLQLAPHSLPKTVKATWKGSQIKQWLALGLQARGHKSPQKLLSIQGDHEETLRALRILFELLPLSARRNCSFDIGSLGQTEQANWWATGRNDKASGDSTIVAASSLDIKGAAVVNLNRDDPYLCWLIDSLEENSPAALGQAREVRCLFTAAAERSRLEDIEITDHACEAFRTYNNAEFSKLLESTIGHRLGKKTTRRISDWAVHSDTYYGWIRYCLGPDKVQSLCDLLCQWIVNPTSSSSPNRTETEQLCALADEAKHPLLKFLATALAPKVKAHPIEEALSNLSKTDYEKALQFALPQVSPAFFLKSSHRHRLMQPDLMDQLSHGQLQDLFLGLIEQNDGPAIEKLTDRIHALTPREARHILKRLKGTSPCSQSVVHRLEAKAKERNQRFNIPFLSR